MAEQQEGGSHDVDTALEAARSTSWWLAEDYERCLGSLELLECSREPDSRVQVNKAVAQYYAQGMDQGDLLQKELESILVKRGAGSGSCLEMSCFADTSYVTATLNLAIHHYTHGNNKAALQYLQTLYEHVEALHDGVAVRTCLLLVDLYLEQGQVGPAASVLAHASRLFPMELSTMPVGTIISESDLSNTTPVAESSGQEETRGLPTERPCADMPVGSEAGEKLALPQVSWLQSPITHQARALLEQQGGKPHTHDLPALVWLYSLKLCMALRDIPRAKQEMESLTLVCPGSEVLAGYGAYLELLKGSFKKSARALQEHGREEPASWSLEALNNLGIVHHCLGQHQMAALYLTMALARGKTCSAAGPAGLNCGDPSAVLYNCGVQHLLMHNYDLALACFESSAASYWDEPLLWMRMAECCIGAYLASCSPSGAPQPPCPEAVPGSAQRLGAGSACPPLEKGSQEVHGEDLEAALSCAELHLLRVCRLSEKRLQALPPKPSAACTTHPTPSPSYDPQTPWGTPHVGEWAHNGALGASASQEGSSNGKSGGGPSYNLEGEDALAQSPIQLGILLNEESSSTGTGHPKVETPLPMIADRHRLHLVNLKQAAAVKLAYVHLLQKQWQKALDVAKGVMENAPLRPLHRFLGHLYAAEALTRQGRLVEAVEQLKQELSSFGWEFGYMMCGAGPTSHPWDHCYEDDLMGGFEREGVRSRC